jgi:hypothetical protein
MIAIYYLDCCLFGKGDTRAGMIAQDKYAADKLFRDKVKFAYDNLPPEIKARFPLARDSASELLFAHNNSSITVGTSMRSERFNICTYLSLVRFVQNTLIKPKRF